MTDRLDFEARLQARLVAHTVDVVRPFDAAAITASAAAARTRHGAWGLPTSWRSRGVGLPLVAALLLLGLLIALVGALLLSGNRPTLPTVIVPTSPATPAPVAVEVPPGAIPPPPSFPASSSKPVPGQAVMTRVADMKEVRIEPVVVALADGRVLVIGGMSDASAEVFDPKTGRFTVTDPGSTTGSGSGVRLRDGRVLVVLYDGNHVAAAIDVFDPRTMTWTRVTAKGYLGTELDGSGPIRRNPTLTLLRDGRVLMSGGEVNSPGGGTGTVVDTAEIFDPATDTVSPTGAMLEPRTGHSATLLRDGRVLIAGGQGLCDTARSALRSCDLPALQDAEIYDPASGTFIQTGSMSGIRGATEGLMLSDGRVLVLQVSAVPSDGQPLGIDGPGLAEKYDPSSGTFSVAPPTPHPVLSATLLLDGRVFLTAQWDLPTSERGRRPFRTWAGVFDPRNGLTQDAPAPPAGWQQPAILADGRILLVGGVVSDVAPDGGLQVVPWAELYRWH